MVYSQGNCGVKKIQLNKNLMLIFNCSSYDIESLFDPFVLVNANEENVVVKI